MTTFAGVPTSAAAKLPQQQALVIALDDFGQRTATSAHGHIVDLALGLGLPSPRSLPIGWLAAERSGGEWQGASLDAPGPSAPLSGLIGQTLAAYPMQDRYAVFLAAKVETPADVDALISAAQVWRDYAALHRDIAGTAQVFGFCYVPSRRDSADPAVLTARSQALHRLAEAIEGQWSPCRHVLLFEDGALAEGGDEPFAERLGHLLALLLTNRPLADYYAGLPEQIALWQHRQFFSSFSAAALALPAAALAHRAGLDLTTRYLNGWLLTAERTTEGEQAFEAAQGQRDRLLAVARWEEEIRQHCAAEFSLFDGTPHVSGGSHDPWEAKPRFLDMPRIYSNLPPGGLRWMKPPVWWRN
ncbi:MAG: hypothetical protein NTZ05_17820 [Chloroflexi bacterium]|nr:hypothetical protein [Chloroflexota bacterium]